MGKIYDIEAGRLRRWERVRSDQFKPYTDESLAWVCFCGCWQFEIKPIGVFCCACRVKQFLSITSRISQDPTQDPRGA